MTARHYTLESLQACNSAGYLIKRCGILMTQIAERRFESQPITFTQWIVLAQLSEHPSLTPTELREQIGHDMGALTRIVDDLLKKQLVVRERSELDRRAVRITITAEGRRLAKAAKAIVLELANTLVEPYSRSETDLLISLLQRMLANMESLSGELKKESSRIEPKPAAPLARQAGGRRRKQS
jgi:DNA-binding MarR family transcriptional regulator